MIFISLRTVALLGISSALVFGAQAPDEKNPASVKAKGDKMAGDKMASGGKTMTGCLSAGMTDNEFSFVEDGSGKRYNVTGTPDLSKHAMNHTVRITADSHMGSETMGKSAGSTATGNETREGHATNKETSGDSRGQSLKAMKVEHVSDTCPKK